MTTLPAPPRSFKLKPSPKGEGFHPSPRETLNSSISAIEKYYSDMNRALMEKKIEPDNYIDNLVGIDEKLELIIPFAKDAQKEIRDTTALIRVIIIKDKPLFTRIAHWFLISKPISNSNSLLVREKEKITSEIESIAVASKRRIEKLLEDNDATRARK